jgi:glutathione S-transferase
MSDRPVLWHLPVSHYNEKARWALDYKRIPHERRTALGSAHMPVALALSRGRSITFPVMRIGDRTYTDSTEIIAALETLKPDPPLYPRDRTQRARALELEDWFDEHVGPAVRHLVFSLLMTDEQGFEQAALAMTPLGPLARMSALRGGAARLTRTVISSRFGIGSGAEQERNAAAVRQAFDRLDAELGDGEHLAGDSFSVADLTAAAMLYPLVRPPEAPQVFRRSAVVERWCEPLTERPGWRWVRETYRRHRSGSGVRPGAATGSLTTA